MHGGRGPPTSFRRGPRQERFSSWHMDRQCSFRTCTRAGGVISFSMQLPRAGPSKCLEGSGAARLAAAGVEGWGLARIGKAAEPGTVEPGRALPVRRRRVLLADRRRFLLADRRRSQNLHARGLAACALPAGKPSRPAPSRAPSPAGALPTQKPPPDGRTRSGRSPGRTSSPSSGIARLARLPQLEDRGTADGDGRVRAAHQADGHG